MDALAWQSVETPASSRMAEARRQAHNAVHWMARVANSYVEPEDGAAHVSLHWNPDTNALRTKAFSDDVSVELRLGGLELQFCEHGVPVPHVLSFEDRTPAHVEAWVLVELLHRGIARTEFSKTLPYEARDLMLGDSEEHAPGEYTAELAALDGWFRNAAALFIAMRSDLATENTLQVNDEPLTCWPEQFQLGFELPLLQGSGASALRVALSAGDELRPEPYFLVATRDEIRSGNIEANNLLSVRRIVADKTSADDVLSFLQIAVSDKVKRLAG